MKKPNYEFVKKMITEAKVVKINNLTNSNPDVLLVPENRYLTPQDYSNVIWFLETVCVCRCAIGYDERLDRHFTTRVLDKWDKLEHLLVEYFNRYEKYADYKNMLFYSSDTSSHSFKVFEPFLRRPNDVQANLCEWSDEEKDYVPSYVEEMEWYWNLYHEGILKIAPEHFKWYGM